MSSRRPQGDETWHRLLLWTSGQKASERLAGHILAAEGFDSIDPSHPLGGRDGLKDLVCWKNGIKWVAAAYFPNGRKSFANIKSKFNDDVKGVDANNAGGFVFVTNQHLSNGERDNLRSGTTVPNVEIYHLERIVLVLDRPENYGVRQDFLGIDMTNEEMVAFFASITASINEWREFRSGEWREEVRQLIQEAISKHQG
jgi:hypothetical protein